MPVPQWTGLGTCMRPEWAIPSEHALHPGLDHESMDTPYAGHGRRLFCSLRTSPGSLVCPGRPLRSLLVTRNGCMNSDSRCLSDCICLICATRTHCCGSGCTVVLHGLVFTRCAVMLVLKHVHFYRVVLYGAPAGSSTEMVVHVRRSAGEALCQ